MEIYMSRQCKCGGQVVQHQMTNQREAWRCTSCGRYQLVGIRYEVKTINKEIVIKKYNG